jgi:ABC-type transport system substrate-binding protein
MTRASSRKLRFTLKFAAGCVAAALGLTGLVWATAAFFRPDLTRQPEPRAAAEVQQARQARNPRLTPKTPPVVVQTVDYPAGSQAAWWPKGEAPVLAALVREGKLPPVAERTGPEPVVMAGMESAVGRYGGTWHRLATNPEDIEGVIRTRLSYSSLVRWSPQGYPIVPHIAKSWSVSPDQREWTFTLREGLRWSDGAPFTTDDIMFWWQWEAQYFRSENVIFHSASFMRHTGQLGRLEQVDKLTVKFSFDEPNSFFLEKMASSVECFRPAHYLRKYHPALGDPQLLADLMKAMNLPSPEAVYQRLLGIRNPEHPRMWPWVYMDYRSSAPQGFVRNPYYYAVDPQGNQLPYLDRVLFDIKNRPMITAAIAGGELTFQDRHIDFEDYTLLSSETKRRGYTLRHWYFATRTMAQIGPNLNRIVKPDEPESAWKKRLLNERDFRRALSLAINRQEIIDAVFNGVGEPGQSSPGPDSPYYNDRHFHSYAAFDPTTANTLLDGLGLTSRDREGFRTYPDGTRMTWFLNLAESFPPDTAHMIATHWQQVGLRTTVQIHPRTLWQVEQAALEHDFTFWPRPGGIHADDRPALLCACQRLVVLCAGLGPLVCLWRPARPSGCRQTGARGSADWASGPPRAGALRSGADRALGGGAHRVFQRAAGDRRRQRLEHQRLHVAAAAGVGAGRLPQRARRRPRRLLLHDARQHGAGNLLLGPDQRPAGGGGPHQGSHRESFETADDGLGSAGRRGRGFRRAAAGVGTLAGRGAGLRAPGGAPSVYLAAVAHPRAHAPRHLHHRLHDRAAASGRLHRVEDRGAFAERRPERGLPAGGYPPELPPR